MAIGNKRHPRLGIRAARPSGDSRREERCSTETNNIRGGYDQELVRAMDDAGMDGRNACRISAAGGDVDNDEVGTRA